MEGFASADWIALHSLYGVYGMSRACTPSGLSASMTALAMVGMARVVPASVPRFEAAAMSIIQP
jgi:hypothetical protein